MTRVNKNNHIQNKQRFMASRLNNKLGRYALLSLLAFGNVSAYGQEANEETEKDESDVERIVVTVERRSQDIQDLGGTAFAFSGEELKSQGIQDITDIAESIPGLEIGNNQGNVEVWIRGIGSSNNTELGDPAAATHLGI